MGVSLMKEEWKSVSMRHGEPFVITLVHMVAGISLRLMLFVNNWDTQELVSYNNNIIIMMVHIDIELIGELFPVYSSYHFGNGSSAMRKAYTTCRGFESSLAECAFTSSTYIYSISHCNRNYGSVGVLCRASKHKYIYLLHILL